jgi:hypothetical protein
MMSGVLKFVFLLSLLALAMPQCSQQPNNQFQLGSTTFVNSLAGSAKRQYNFPITLNFQVSPSILQVAACNNQPIQRLPRSSA